MRLIRAVKRIVVVLRMSEHLSRKKKKQLLTQFNSKAAPYSHKTTRIRFTDHIKYIKSCETEKTHFKTYRIKNKKKTEALLLI
jgi:hypothetical protein